MSGNPKGGTRPNTRDKPAARSPPPAAPIVVNPPPLDESHSALAKTIASQLVANTYECMVCTEVVRHTVATWSCAHCYRIFHLFCIKKWSKQEDSGEGRSFRCPSCQHPVTTYPNKYRCFCGKAVDPPVSGFTTPHSCGDTCGKARSGDCPHRCTLQCHPGPCPDCNLKVPPKPCPCGRTTYTYPCGKSDPKKTCDSICGKPLSCGTHTCQQTCHYGPCKPCAVVEEVSCHCGRDDKQLPCGSKSYSCGDPCGRLLRCGEHHCTIPCHDGNCAPCDGDPEVVKTCPCGKQSLKTARTKCTDPIPTCGLICGKVLLCGNHTCDQECHSGPCPPCEAKVALSCPCGSQKGMVYCKEQQDFHCHKKCKTRLSCGKHECENICCAFKNLVGHAAHNCTRICGKKLPCGHQCPENCHRGACPPCLNVITTSVSCFCGAEELIPPLPCGTQPPQCNLPCRITRPCGHESAPHSCHFGPCPPCMHSVTRRCAGDHKEVSGVACSSAVVSCGQICNKKLSCGHSCPRKCHAGDCETPVTDVFSNENPSKAQYRCTQQCLHPLPCGHKCQAACHPKKPCPPCTSSVEIRCDCGHLRQKLLCKVHAQKKRELPEGLPLALDCTDECTHQKRLEVLSALRGSKGGDIGTKVIYSIKAWTYAKEHVEVVKSIEKRLIDFIQSGEHTLNLPHMPPEKRMMVHELCGVFHLHSESVDREPVRSCLVTRHSKSAIPTPLLSEAVYVESNDPTAFCTRILSSEAMCMERIIVMSGPHLTDVAINAILKPYCGTFVVVPASDGEKTDEGYVFNVIFTSKHDMTQAYSFLRKSDGKVAFRMFGHSSAPTNPDAVAAATAPTKMVPTTAATASFTRAGFGSAGAAKKTHTDPTTAAAPTASASGGGGGGSSSSARPSASSWATLLKTKPADEAKKKEEPMEVRNMFATLNRKK